MAPRRRPGDNAGMQIQLNGAPLAIEAGTSLAMLLDAQGLAQRRVAVEVDGEIVPRARHAGLVLREGAKVEIVHALGGG